MTAATRTAGVAGCVIVLFASACGSGPKSDAESARPSTTATSHPTATSDGPMNVADPTVTPGSTLSVTVDPIPGLPRSVAWTYDHFDHADESWTQTFMVQEPHGDLPPKEWPLLQEDRGAYPSVGVETSRSEVPVPDLWPGVWRICNDDSPEYGCVTLGVGSFVHRSGPTPGSYQPMESLRSGGGRIVDGLVEFSFARPAPAAEVRIFLEQRLGGDWKRIRDVELDNSTRVGATSSRNIEPDGGPLRLCTDEPGAACFVIPKNCPQPAEPYCGM